MLDEFLSRFGRHSDDLKRAIDDLRDELDSCDKQHGLLRKKYDTAVQEVRLLRKCKQDQDGRESQLFSHTRHLVDMIEQQKFSLKQKDTQIQILNEESERMMQKISESARD